MAFSGLLCAAIAIYGLLNFVILPRLTKAWNAGRTPEKIARAGLLGALQFARDTALVVAAGYLLLAALVLTLNFSFGHSAVLLEWATSTAAGAHNRLAKIEALKDHWFFLLPLAALIVIHVRSRTNRFSRRFERLVDEELDRLNADRARNPKRWESLPPDERMTAFDEQLLSARERLAEVPHGDLGRVKRRFLLRLIAQLTEQRNERDYERRIDFEAANIREERTRWQAVLMSRGLFSDVKGASRLLNYVTVAALSIALIGVAGDVGLSKNLSDGILRLDDLRIEARKNESEDRWKQRPSRPVSLTASDTEAIQQLSHDFVRALNRNPRWYATAGRPSSAFREGLNRRAILDRIRLPNQYGQTEPAFASGFSSSEREIVRDIAANTNSESRVARVIAREHGSDVRSWFGDRWEKVKVGISEHAKTYRQPVGVDDLRGDIVDRIVSAAFDATSPEGASDIVTQARAGMSEATKKAVREVVETELHRVVEDLESGEPYAESIEKVRSGKIGVQKARAEDLAAVMHKSGVPTEQEWAERVTADAGSWKSSEPPSSSGSAGGDPSGSRPSGPAGSSSPTAGPTGGATDSPDIRGRGPSRASPETDSIVSAIAREHTNGGQYSLRPESVGALAEYEDYFPRSVASQEATRLGRVLATHRLAQDASFFTRVAQLNVTRAGSFSMLRGFSRVGGVLIGREPDGGGDFRDLDWTVVGRDVMLILVDSRGKRASIGTFDAGLIHQALGYAADGRPVAVTMTFAEPIKTLKVLLHPSLLDTPLGCAVQELDRLVDTYAGRELPERSTMTSEFAQQVAVYNVALGKRVEAVAEKAESSYLQKLAEAIVRRYEPDAEKGLQQEGVFSDASILRRKAEFFDPLLVRTGRKCQTRSLKAFENCVTKFYRADPAVRTLDKHVLGRWPMTPAQIQPLSGVRERSYVIDADLAFLKAPATDSVRDRLWPFDFIAQIAFTSAAVNLPEQELEEYVDREPIEFTSIQTRIEDLVLHGIDNGRHMRGVSIPPFRSHFEYLRQFAVLQRLFRAALTGKLGANFPTMNLANLAEDTAGVVAYHHTRRWNASVTRHFLLMMQQVAQPGGSPETWMKEAAPGLRLCTEAMEAALAATTDHVTEQACSFGNHISAAEESCKRGNDAGCLWVEVIRLSSAMPEIVRNEIAFGVLDDERTSVDAACPPVVPGNVLSQPQKR